MKLIQFQLIVVIKIVKHVWGIQILNALNAKIIIIYIKVNV